MSHITRFSGATGPWNLSCPSIHVQCMSWFEVSAFCVKVLEIKIRCDSYGMVRAFIHRLLAEPAFDNSKFSSERVVQISPVLGGITYDYQSPHAGYKRWSWMSWANLGVNDEICAAFVVIKHHTWIFHDEREFQLLHKVEPLCLHQPRGDLHTTSSRKTFIYSTVSAWG